MKHYLVTGAAGFIGAALCRRLLDQGFKVIGVDNFSRGSCDSEFQMILKHKNFEFHEANLADSFPTAISGEFEVVFHLASAVGVEEIISRPYETFESNLRSLFVVLGWLEKTQVKKFVYTSSSEVYGWDPNVIVPTPEEVELVSPRAHLPRGGYALSKISGEFLVTTRCEELNIPFIIVRPHNVYGPRMGHSHVIPQLIKKINQCPDVLPVNNAHFTRSFCFIQDALDQLLGLCEVCRNEIVNVGDDQEEIEIGQLANLIALNMQKTVLIKSNDNPSDPFKRRCPDLKKNRSFLKSIQRTSLNSGLAQTISWYQEHS